MGPPSFLAFYLTAGTAASLGGMAAKVATGSTNGSLGTLTLTLDPLNLGLCPNSTTTRK